MKQEVHSRSLLETFLVEDSFPGVLLRSCAVLEYITHCATHFWNDVGAREMGNLVPCGGTPSNGRNGSSRRCSGSGRLLSANISGFSNRSSGDAKAGESLIPPASSIQGNSSSALGTIWRQSECINYRNFRLRRPKIRAIVALPKHSPQYNAAKWALERLGVESVLTFSTETAIQALNNGLSSTPHLVLLDSRHPRNIDAEALAKHVRQSPYGNNIVVVGVVKKSFIEHEEVIVASHLRAGFDRVLIDSGSRGYWMNELVLLLHNDVDTNIKLNCSESVLTALESCQDIVQITDKQNRLIYGNPTAQKVLGFSQEELNNKCIWDYQSTKQNSNPISCDSSSSSSNNLLPTKSTLEPPLSDDADDVIKQKLDTGKVWEGPLNCRRKSGDYLALDTKIIPISFSSRRNSDHVIYVRKTPNLSVPPIPSSSSAIVNNYNTMNNTKSSSCSNNTNNNHSNSSSCQISQHHLKHLSSTAHSSKALKQQLHENHCTEVVSTSMASGNYYSGRRQSGSILPGMSIEAPITKIINIILSVQEKSPASIVSELDKVIEILQATTGTTDLFSPELSKDGIKKRPDPVATDLLLELFYLSSIVYRQSIKVRSTSVRGRNSTRDALTQRRGSTDPVAVSNTKNTSIHRTSLPNFDNSPVATRHLLENSSKWEFNILELEKLTNKRCLVWLGMTVFFFDFKFTKLSIAQSPRFKIGLLLLKQITMQIFPITTLLTLPMYFMQLPISLSLLESKSIVTVAFLCNSGNGLANLYNDITVLENHHASLGFKLTQSDKRVNIFQNLDKDSYKLIRQGVIDLVLATDMSKHFVHVNKFASVFNTIESGECSVSDVVATDGSDAVLSGVPNTPENVAILKRMLIKCADVANPARPLHICKVWAFRIAEEYFSQTDDEKRLGLTVVMPQFDRATCSITKSQIGFYDFFINDMFDCLNNFDDFHKLVDIIQFNYNYWKQEAEEEENAKDLQSEEEVKSSNRSKSASEKEDIREEDEDIPT
ncbi:PDE8 [Lepeophtheirus salmonis]|uniref:PDE8 n=1 Tax=Lepeophtheirus salmonis TaxID=72036 RepID=A0A7R8CWA0_LEPSM|nr:PDE8 [Lepeophtheirus salmonis]CAF2920287.1 PDE8 [Lepeophtheirus salmonis]